MRIQFDLNPNHLAAALLMASDDESRYVLNGVRVELDGPNVRCVSTDGRRLIVLNDHNDGRDLANLGFILHKDTVRRILPQCAADICDECGTGIKYSKIIGNLSIEINAEPNDFYVEIFTDRGVVCCTTANHGLIDGQYANWKQVVQTTPRCCAIPAVSFNQKLLDDFRRAAQMLRGSANAPTLFFHGEFHALTVRFPGLEEFYGLLMPVRADHFEKPATPLPPWLHTLLTAPTETIPTRNP